MLSNYRVQATIPTPDPQALRTFYEGTLRLTPYAERPSAILYKVGEGSMFVLSRSGIKPAGHTQMSFLVPDVEAEVVELRGRGVVFEEYEMPKTENGVARMPAGKAAWFKDPDGNLIGIFQFDEPV